MKKIIYVTLSVIAFLVVMPVYGQSKYGADSAECVKNLSIYLPYMKQGSIAEAAVSWRKAIAVCPPQASQNMLLDGMKILRSDIKTYGKNPVRRKELIDSIIMLHNMRMEAFPLYQNQIRVNLAKDMINLCKDRPEEVLNSIDLAMQYAKEKVPVALPVMYMNITCDLYKNGKKSEEDVMNAFTTATANLELIQAAKPSADVANAISDVEGLFSQSGVASCEKLSALFQPKFDQNPDDTKLASTIVNLFKAQDCLSEPLFALALENVYAQQPSYSFAYLLYQLNSKAGNTEKAQQFMKEAIAFDESDANQDAAYCFELATYEYRETGNLASAVEYAKEAAALSNEWAGKAYMLIGTIWGSQKADGDYIDIRAPYLVAVDYLTKAKAADPSLAEEANKLISSYKQYFPAQGEAFMLGLKNGDVITARCAGMTETTKLRTQD